jgi:3-phenylpropionate/trans-cinnamate dioxygenase ferredoxin reductase subunit
VPDAVTDASWTFVVVGAGQAGAWVARTLRKEGFAGRIVLIGEEAHWPYERPPLSKGFLQGTSDEAAMTLLGPEMAAALDIDCRRGRSVTAIDRAACLVHCDDGAVLAYQTLFLTTGGKARSLPGLESDRSGRIHTLRTRDDATRLRAALAAGGGSLLVIGGGWIGLEAAAAARSMGVEVTVVESANRLCARSMPPVVSDFLHALHARRGVAFQMPAAIGSLDPNGFGVTVTFSDGLSMRTDHALVGIGINPDTTLASECGLDVADGIVVDAQGRTSDPAIFAAGDVARYPDRPAVGPLRLESWANAQNGAVVAAKAALGQDVSHGEVPWFWSDQYDVNLQFVGHPGLGVQPVPRGTPAEGAGCWLMLDAAGTATGAVAVNAPRELRTVRKMLERGLQPAPAAWADAGIPLAQVPAIAPPGRAAA